MAFISRLYGILVNCRVLYKRKVLDSIFTFNLSLLSILQTLKLQISDLPNEKEAVYGALDKWTAWETEFPLIAAAKALSILKKRSQWKRLIQV